jgi:RNA polymerase sigma-70 factor, ECF subfamily
VSSYNQRMLFSEEPQSALLDLHEEFDTVVRLYRKRLVSMASRYRLSSDSAEDAVQRGLLKAWKALPTFRRDCKLSSWLTTIVLNEVLQILRREKRAVMVPIMPEHESEMFERERGSRQAHCPEARLLQQERMEQLNGALAGLTPTMRGAVSLYLVNELSVKEAARILAISLPSAKSRIARGRRALKQKLTEVEERDCA